MFPMRVHDDYFPAYEVARRASKISSASTEEIYAQIATEQIRPFIPPGTTASGFVFAQADEGLKSIWVDLHGRTENREFHFVLPVPGLPSPYFDIADDHVEVTDDLDLTALRSWLEDLLCCITLEDGTPGDPVNLAFVATLEELRAVLISRGWDVTAPVSWGALRRMAGSFLFNLRYRYAPISSLYLFDREQDMAFQKARAVIDERNHMRLWLAPVSHDGRPV
jgi:hypothetical protein